MKVCTKCETEKSFDEFWKAKRSPDGHQAWCKKCSTERRTVYYHENREREEELRKEWSAHYQTWALLLKSDPCSRCLDDSLRPWQKHWHHRDPSTKIDNVSTLTTRRVSKERVLEEIAKCDLLCANCHADVTYIDSKVEVVNKLLGD